MKISWLLLFAVFLISGCAGPRVVGDSPVDLANRGQETHDRARARIRTELAVGYFQQGQIGVALDELKLALQADSTFPDAHNLLALVYMQMNERSRAEESFATALKLAPHDSEINNNYGWFLCQTAREKLSINYFLTAIKNPLYSTPSKPLINAGICSSRVEDLTAAEDYLTRALAIDASNPIAMYQMANVCLKKKEYGRAWFYINRLNSSFSPTAESLWLGIRIAYYQGERDIVRTLSQQLRRKFPGSKEFGFLNREAYDEQ